MKTEMNKGKVIEFTPSANVLSGELVAIGDQVGVAITDIALSVVGSVQIEGAFDGVAKTTSESWAVGDELYLDTATKKLTKTGAGNIPAGQALAVAQSSDTIGSFKIAPAKARAAYVAQNATANGSDAGTTQTLANALKVTVNNMLTELKAAGLMKNS